MAAGAALARGNDWRPQAAGGVATGRAAAGGPAGATDAAAAVTWGGR